MMGTQSLDNVSTKQERIAKLARERPQLAITTLAHHIDIQWLEEAFRRTRKDGASGVDGQTAADYAVNLQEKLQSLLNRAKSGDNYRAPPVRRVHIPKGDGAETRPIGIPTIEDKLLQRAVVMALEPVYEQDFLNCSYGFRPGRSAHQALEALWRWTTTNGGGWILEVDIRKFFDNLDHKYLQEIVRKRVRDGVLLRLIGKWLNAGVMESGSVSYSEKGSPQGGVISPLLANIYLHEVLDKWFEDEVKPRLKGPSTLIRYADDFVACFVHEEDARRVMAVLGQRFAKYGLELHPSKTRLIAFNRPDSGKEDGRDDPPQSGTFDFLGFTHHWGVTYKGRWTVKRRTAKSRLSRSIKRIALWCKAHRHDPIQAQHEALSRKLQGHYGYFGITGNHDALNRFHHQVKRQWHKWLARRSQRGMLWERFVLLLNRLPLPRPRVMHSMLVL